MTTSHLMLSMLNIAVSIFLCTCDERNSAQSIAGCPSCALVLFSRNWTGTPMATILIIQYLVANQDSRGLTFQACGAFEADLHDEGEGKQREARIREAGRVEKVC